MPVNGGTDASGTVFQQAVSGSATTIPTVNLTAGSSGVFSTTAANGTDYTDPDNTALGGSAAIPAGAARFKLKLKALVDPAKTEKIKIVLEPDPAGSYQLGTSTKAGLKLE